MYVDEFSLIDPNYLPLKILMRKTKKRTIASKKSGFCNTSKKMDLI